MGVRLLCVSRRLRLTSDHPVDAVTTRLAAALGEPWVIAVEDRMNARHLLGGGPPYLIGRLERGKLSVWNRVGPDTPGMYRFVGSLRGSGPGSELDGVIQLKWSARVVNFLAPLIAVAFIAGLAVAGGWPEVSGPLVFFALVAAFITAMHVKDRRSLIDRLQAAINSDSSDT